jgi:hypothetical protein
MSKFGFVGLIIAATLVCTLAFPAAATGPKVAAAPAPVFGAPPPVPAVAAAMPARHPQIHEALEAMRAARHHLEGAEHDFDGHRGRALEHLDQAIREAEICMSIR